MKYTCDTNTDFY